MKRDERRMIRRESGKLRGGGFRKETNRVTKVNLIARGNKAPRLYNPRKGEPGFSSDAKVKRTGY